MKVLLEKEMSTEYSCRIQKDINDEDIDNLELRQLWVSTFAWSHVIVCSNLVRRRNGYLVRRRNPGFVLTRLWVRIRTATSGSQVHILEISEDHQVSYGVCALSENLIVPSARVLLYPQWESRYTLSESLVIPSVSCTLVYASTNFRNILTYLMLYLFILLSVFARLWLYFKLVAYAIQNVAICPNICWLLILLGDT